MLKRTITALVGLVVFFALLFAGRMPFNCAVIAVTAIMVYEINRSVKCHKALWVTGYLSMVGIVIGSITESYFHLIIFLIIAMYMAVSVALHEKVSFREIYSQGFLVMFVSVFMNSVMMLRTGFGIYAVLLVFICAWTTDTGAYFAGRFFGKHKLMPRVSPKKTIEGAVGGVVICVLSNALYFFILNRIPGTGIHGMERYLPLLVLAAAASVFSQLGDLVASAIKRDCGVKDFGNLLPGHGGILDRFDSVVFIAPFIYYLMKLFTWM